MAVQFEVDVDAQGLGVLGDLAERIADVLDNLVLVGPLRERVAEDTDARATD